MDLAITDEITLETSKRTTIYPHLDTSINLMFQDPQPLPCLLVSHRRALLSTLEVVEIPMGCIGLICLRSTWARLGLISPPTVADPGFHGQLTMEIFNGSSHDIVISPRCKIWSMQMLHQVVGWEEGPYQGRYQDQKGIQIPKAIT